MHKLFIFSFAEKILGSLWVFKERTSRSREFVIRRRGTTGERKRLQNCRENLAGKHIFLIIIIKK